VLAQSADYIFPYSWVSSGASAMGCGSSVAVAREGVQKHAAAEVMAPQAKKSEANIAGTRLFSPQEAADIFNEHKDKFGRCAYQDLSAQGDQNTLRGIWARLRGAMPRASTSWSTLVVVNTNIHEGLIALLLERASVFAASGAEGMQPAGHCLNMACKIVIEVNEAMRDEARQEQLGSEQLKEATAKWTLTIREIRKKCRVLPVSQRKEIPLFYFDAKLSQLEIAVTAIRDPKAQQKALFAAFNIGKSIVLSIATMKVDDKLFSNLCTGLNLAVERRIQINAERNFIMLFELMQRQQHLRNCVHAPVRSNAASSEILVKAKDSARRMQAVFQHDPSQENAIFLAECLAETLIGTSDQNYSHLDKDVIAFLLRGEPGRDDEPESSTNEKRGDDTFRGLWGLATFGADSEASMGGAANLLRLRTLMDEVLEGVWQGKTFDLGDTVVELVSMIEPEVLNALQDSVARGRDVVKACAEAKLGEFEKACIDVLQGKRSKELVKEIETAGRHANAFIGRLKAGMEFVDTLVTLLGKSVDTALVIVENAINMLQMLVKILAKFEDSMKVEEMVKNMAGKKSYVAQQLKKMAIAKLRPKLELHLDRNGATWEEALPALETITLEIWKECAETGIIEPIVEKLVDASGPIAFTRRMLQPGLASASDVPDLDGTWKAKHVSDSELVPQTVASNLDVQAAITEAGANMGTDGIDVVSNTDVGDCILECLVALRHVKSSLESVSEVAGVAKSIQQEAVTVGKVGDNLVKGLSALLEEATDQHVIADARKVDGLVGHVKFLSGFVREKVVGMAVRVDDTSRIFGSAMTFLRCSAAIDINFGDDLARNLAAGVPSLSLPSKITVQATGEIDPVSEKLQYGSTCSKFTIHWEERGWAVRSAAASGSAAFIVLSCSGYEDGLTAGQWKVQAFKPSGDSPIFETLPDASTRFREVGLSFGAEEMDEIKKKFKEEVEDLLSRAKYALQDQLHQVCTQAEDWAEEQLAAAEDALGVDMGEMEAGVDALSACFAPSGAQSLWRRGLCC